MSANPFPGPQPYRASDRARFFGREELSYRLEGSVLANRCVTVYGPSGAGKSSLVQASVMPALVESQEIRVVRVDAWPEDQPPVRWLASAVYADLGYGTPPEDLSPEAAVMAAVKRAARRSPRLVVVYLDQIEQLLYPSRDAEASEALFDHVAELVDLPLRNLRVVLSLREDYLGRFRDRLREHRRVLDHGFRVGPLTVAELTRAVCQAAATGDPPQTWEEREMRALMLQVRVPGQSATDDAEAQSAYAQIVCRALFEEREAREERERVRRERGGAEGAAREREGAIQAEPILERYLEATLADLGESRGAATRLLEDHLVTADGSRTLRTEKELSRVLPAEALSPILKALEDAAILHAEAHQGTRYFEIGHDWLARKVFEDRERRELEEEQRKRDEDHRLELLRQSEEAQAKVAQARRQRRAFAFIALASLAVTAGAGALGGLAIRARKAAEEAKLAADEAQREAERREVEAHDARILSGFRELAARGKLAWGMKLLPEVERPAELRDWVELATEALNANALRATLKGHEGSLSAAVWSPGGTRVLTAGADTTARIFRSDGGGAPLVLKGHTEALLSAAWSPDGARVVTASEDGTARVWSAEGGGEPVVLRGHTEAVVAAAFSPDGQRVLTASRDKTARIFRADGTGAPVVLSEHKGAITAALWMPDGERVITASEDGTARVWEAAPKGKSVVLRGHGAEVLSAAVSADGKRIVTTSRDKTARVWDGAGTGKPVVLEGHEGTVYEASFSPDGRLVATASADRTARVWSADGKGKPVVLQGHELSVSSVAFQPGGRYVATASADRTARLWPADGSGAPLVLRGHDAPVRSAAWSPDGTRVLTAAGDSSGRSLDATAKVWSAEPLRSLSRERGDEGFFHSAFIGARGETVLAAYDDNTARLFRVEGETELALFRGHEGWVASAALSQDGSRVVTASFDKTARVWNANGAGDPVILRGHEAEVRAAAFDKDGERVVTASDDKTARIFRLNGGGDPIVLRGHEDWVTAASFSPDGARVATASLDRTARVWSADGKGAPIVLAGHRGDVHWVAWSPDGKLLVTASEDRTARVWGADGSGEKATLPSPGGAVLRAVWSPDGARIATASSDATIRVFRVGGKESPIVIDRAVPALALAFLGGDQTVMAVDADNVTRWWMIDTNELTKRLREAHADCLPPDVWSFYVGPSAQSRKLKASDVFAACERAHGREPAAPEGKGQ